MKMFAGWLVAIGTVFSASQAMAKSDAHTAVCENREGGWMWYTAERTNPDIPYHTCDNDSRGERLEQGSTYPIFTNNSTKHSMWITIYDVGELVQKDWGCVPAHSGRRWASGNYNWGSAYKVRAEVKANADCRGETLFDTRFQIVPRPNFQSFAGWGSWEDVIANLHFSGSGYYLASGNDDAGPANVPTLPSKPIKIRSRVDDSKVLSLDIKNPNCSPGGQEFQCRLIIDDIRENDPMQIWDRVYRDNGISFINRFTKMQLWTPNGNGAEATLVGAWRNDEGSKWTIGGDCTTNCALRPQRDSGQNLNVFGGAPYIKGTRVGTWGWDGGGGNETWYFLDLP